MAQNENRDWIVPGAQVAQYSASDRLANLTTIEKLTATQIVLANGCRYRRDTLMEIGQDRWRRFELLPANHRRVRQVLASEEVSSLTHLLAELLRVRSASATPADMLAMLDQAAEKITAARQRVAELTAEED